MDWAQISQRVRFRDRGPHGVGCCWQCGRPHGAVVRVLPDGRWFDEARRTWRDGLGHDAEWPDIEAATAIRETKVFLAACHHDNDPSNCSPNNLSAWCQRCHMVNDRPFHRIQTRITIMLRRAAGDLFLGPYRYL